MTAVYILAGATAAFLVLAGFLFSGKGSWLIAGFNTASPAEKAHFDRKKLCRTFSVVCLVIALLLGIMGFLGYHVETGRMQESGMAVYALVFILVLVGTLTIVARYINKHCKK